MKNIGASNFVQDELQWKNRCVNFVQVHAKLLFDFFPN